MPPTLRALLVLFGSSLLVPALTGCKSSGDTASSSGPLIDEASRQEARSLFANRCTPCHGATGSGDGPASAGLTPKPRNFHDPTWQGQVTNEHIEQIIQYGGAAVAKSPAMPPNPDLTARPTVVAALREHIRSLKQP